MPKFSIPRLIELQYQDAIAKLIADLLPPLIYLCIPLTLLFHLPASSKASRFFFSSTVFRILLPLQAVSWADFLLADMFCSLSKSMGDLASAFCIIGSSSYSLAFGSSLFDRRSTPFFTLVSNHPTEGLCSPLSLLSMSAICLPYAIRFVQCLIVYYSTGKTSQIFNALKYLSAFPALLLTLEEHERHVHSLPFDKFNLWIFSASFNSLFSFYWDIEMDWDMPWLYSMATASKWLPSSAHHHQPIWRRWLPTLRPNPLFDSPFYAWACFSNLIMRVAWTYRLLGNIESNAVIALGVGLLEVFRRYQWSFIRIETELRKVAGKESSSVALMDEDGRKEVVASQIDESGDLREMELVSIDLKSEE